MIGAGIFNGDLLIVDRSLEASSGKVVIAEVDGQLTVKRLLKLSDGFFSLQSENSSYPPIELQEGNEVVVWGVVTHVIHDLL